MRKAAWIALLIASACAPARHAKPPLHPVVTESPSFPPIQTPSGSYEYRTPEPAVTP
ncbi:MAG: hypothetical protein ABR548_11230 [Actinomycetota bacterium]|nr:hypothetical protein [Actinomycetota bacterium]